jgi:hypothetical protein
MRVLFATLLLGITAIAVFQQMPDGVTPMGQSNLATGQVGRTLFIAFTVSELLVVGVLAPLLVGSALAEDRDGGLLDLVVLTRLGHGRVVWGTVMSRMVLLGMLILAGLPVLALITTFGGVGPWDIVCGAANTLLVGFVVGTMGGITGLFSGSDPVRALAVGAGWAVASFGMFPGLLAFVGLDDDAYWLLSPPAAAFAGEPAGLVPLLFHVPAVWLAVGVVVPLFARTVRGSWALGDDPDPDPHRVLADLRLRRLGVLGLLVPPLIAATIGGWYVAEHYTSIVKASSAQQNMVIGTGAVATGVTTVAAAGLLALAVFRFAAITRHIAPGGGARAATLVRRVTRPLRLPVWWNPVVWREVMTAGGGVSVRALLLTFVIGGVAVPSVLFVLTEGELSLALIGASSLFAVVGATLTIVVPLSSVTAERYQGTLPLLLQTTMSGLSWVVGRVLATGVAAGPFLAYAAAASTLGYVWEFGDDWLAPKQMDPAPWDDLGATLVRDAKVCQSRGLRLPAFTWAAVGVLWIVGVWFSAAIGSVWIALRARTVPTAYALGIALPFVVPSAMGAIDLFQASYDFGRVGMSKAPWTIDAMQSLVVPFSDDGLKYGCGPSPFATVGSAVPLVLAVLLSGWVAVRLRPWILRDAGR